MGILLTGSPKTEFKCLKQIQIIFVSRWVKNTFMKLYLTTMRPKKGTEKLGYEISTLFVCQQRAN